MRLQEFAKHEPMGRDSCQQASNNTNCSPAGKQMRKAGLSGGAREKSLAACDLAFKTGKSWTTWQHYYDKCVLNLQTFSRLLVHLELLADLEVRRTEDSLWHSC